MDLDRIQAALRDLRLDGWLFFDHHQRDPLAYRILGLPLSTHASRRWYYLIPASGEPRGLVHRIESHNLDAVPGAKAAYSRWTEQAEQVRRLLNGMRRIAMQYSPDCAVPYVSMVDAGTIELVRGMGVEVVTSADLVQIFEAQWTEEQRQSHFEAGRRVDAIRRAAFDEIARRLRSRESCSEWDIASFILRSFEREGLVTEDGPIVAVNANASDPHYAPSESRTAPIKPGDLVLIDLWAKPNTHNAVYYDITWTGFCGDEPPSRVQEVFRVVRDARDAGVRRVQEAIARGEDLRGFHVDDAVRGTIEAAGFGPYFVHRTGHSIGTSVHGSGANMDNFESHDERRIIPNTCFSIEPGIYLPEFGIRSEVNVFLSQSRAEVTGEVQQELLRIPIRA
jgi:Xaa-Pro aminopeptidase